MCVMRLRIITATAVLLTVSGISSALVVFIATIWPGAKLSFVTKFLLSAFFLEHVALAIAVWRYRDYSIENHSEASTQEIAVEKA